MTSDVCNFIYILSVSNRSYKQLFSLLIKIWCCHKKLVSLFWKSKFLICRFLLYKWKSRFAFWITKWFKVIFEWWCKMIIDSKGLTMIRNFNPPRSGNIDCLQRYHGLQFALIVKTAFFCQESKCLSSQKTPYTILQSAFDLKKPVPYACFKSLQIL